MKAGGHGGEPRRVAWVVTVSGVVTGLLLRAHEVGTYFPFGDEWHSLRQLRNSYLEILRSYDLLGSGIALPMLQKLAFEACGASLEALRAPALVAGSGTLIATAALSRRLGGCVVAALATVAVAINPAHVYYSHFGRAYALATLFAVLLVHALHGYCQSRDARWRWLALAFVTAALLPWVHLASAALVFGAFLGAGAELWIQPGGRRNLGALVATAVGAFLACAALYAPSASGLLSFVELKAFQGDTSSFSPVDVMTLLAGSWWLGLVWLAALPLGAGWLLARRRSGAVIVACAAATPGIVVLGVQPVGDVFAIARYLIFALPLWLILLAWAWVEACRQWTQRRWLADRAALYAGVAALALIHWTGALARWSESPGPYRNLPLSLRPLAAFDERSAETPPFYTTLAGLSDVDRIIEAPVAADAGLFLYRNYFLTHGKPTRLGYLRPTDQRSLPRAFATVLAPDLGCSAKSDLLILHLDLGAEVTRYWSEVYDRWKVRPDPKDSAFMDALRLTPAGRFGSAAGAVSMLRERLGEPLYRDEVVVAWRLDRSACPLGTDLGTLESPPRDHAR